MIHPPLDNGPVAVGTFHRVCRRAARAPTRADPRPPCPEVYNEEINDLLNKVSTFQVVYIYDVSRKKGLLPFQRGRNCLTTTCSTS